MNDRLSELQRALDQARLDQRETYRRMASNDWSEYQKAHDATLNLEREIAALKGDEYAIPVDFPVAWDTGAPSPHLLVNDHKAFLLFYRSESDPNWDGTSVLVVDPNSPGKASLALVEFIWCTSAKLGSPNDEVFSGHPLEGRGLDAYSAQQVINSKWIKEIQTINSVHSQYSGDGWKLVKHYIFWFHDSTFECLAESFTVEVHNKSLGDLIQHAALRLNMR